MDWGSLAGIALALAGIIGGLTLEGGHAGSLLQPSAFLIVFVGTLGAVLLQSGVATCRRGIVLAGHAFFPPPENFDALVHDLVLWNSAVRREGLLILERFITPQMDPFLARGLRLIVDGADPARIRQTMEQDIDAWEHSQRAAARVWEAAGGYAPTVGILGAVLGLIHVMENLSDPARLGSGIAVAFVATIYGVGLANLLFLPIASKLKAVIAREAFRREVVVDALVGISEGENPRVTEERLSLYLRHG